MFTSSSAAKVFGDKPVTEADILAKEKYAKTGQTYTFKSGNVIELLDSLKTHFEDSKTQATKAETAAANDYEVAKDSRKAAVAAAKKAKEHAMPVAACKLEPTGTTATSTRAELLATARKGGWAGGAYEGTRVSPCYSRRVLRFARPAYASSGR